MDASTNREMNITGKENSKYILVVLNQVDSLLGSIVSYLRELDESGVEVTLLLGPGVEEICTKNGLLQSGNIQHLDIGRIGEIIYHVHEYKILLLPTLGFSSARKLATLDDSEALVKLVGCALREGTRVCMATNSLDTPPGIIGAPRMEKMAQRLLSDISGIGIQLIRLKNLWEGLSVDDRIFPGKVVTGNTVRELSQKGLFDIYISKGTVVTPLGWDMASELGLRINRIKEKRRRE